MLLRFEVGPLWAEGSARALVKVHTGDEADTKAG